MRTQNDQQQIFKMIAKVIQQLADNPYKEALHTASLLHSNRWGTKSWL